MQILETELSHNRSLSSYHCVPWSRIGRRGLWCCRQEVGRLTSRFFTSASIDIVSGSLSRERSEGKTVFRRCGFRGQTNSVSCSSLNPKISRFKALYSPQKRQCKHGESKKHRWDRAMSDINSCYKRKARVEWACTGWPKKISCYRIMIKSYFKTCQQG